MIRKIAAALAGLTTAAGVYVVTGPAASAQTPPPYCADKSNLAIVGASSETGYATTGYPSGAQTFQPTAYGWASRFANSVKSQWGTTVTDYAHNGAMATDYLPGGRWASTTGAIADIAARKPSLVLINLAGNEYNIQKDPAQTQADLGALVDKIRAASPNALILMGIYAEYKWAPNADNGYMTQKYTWAQYGSAVYNTAVAKGTPLLDLRQYIPPAASSQLPSPSPWYTDNIHLNDAGNLAEYGAWWGWTSSLWSTCG